MMQKKWGKPTTITPATIYKEIGPVTTKEIDLSKWYDDKSDKQQGQQTFQNAERDDQKGEIHMTKKMAISLLWADQHFFLSQVFPVQEERIMPLLVSVKKTAVNHANLRTLL